VSANSDGVAGPVFSASTRSARSKKGLSKKTGGKKMRPRSNQRESIQNGSYVGGDVEKARKRRLLRHYHSGGQLNSEQHQSIKEAKKLGCEEVEA